MMIMNLENNRKKKKKETEKEKEKEKKRRAKQSRAGCRIFFFIWKDGIIFFLST